MHVYYDSTFTPNKTYEHHVCTLRGKCKLYLQFWLSNVNQSLRLLFRHLTLYWTQNAHLSVQWTILILLNVCHGIRNLNEFNVYIWCYITSYIFIHRFKIITLCQQKCNLIKVNPFIKYLNGKYYIQAFQQTKLRVWKWILRMETRNWSLNWFFTLYWLQQLCFSIGGIGWHLKPAQPEKGWSPAQEFLELAPELCNHTLLSCHCWGVEGVATVTNEEMWLGPS